MSPMWGVAVVGIGTAVVSAWTGRVVADKSDVNLDADSISCRVAWASDVVCSSALFLASIVGIVQSLIEEKAEILYTVAAVVLLVVSISLLYMQIHHHTYRINGYPESLHPRAKAVMRRREILLPGVVLGVMGQVLLVAASSVGA